jgi:hypothetical protein
MSGEQELQDMGALFFDADGDGDNDLLVASGGGYLAGDASVYQARLHLNDGRGNLSLAPEALPGVSTSASSVVAADYDRDGDLDLFLGGRIVPGRYPLPARSYLLRNDSRQDTGVRFTDVTSSAAPSLAKIGLVNSALWTDFDQDGRVDLLVAGEWMPLTFFRNRDGRFEDVTAATGLGATEGWWNSLVAGDFDDDGDTDYVAGNLGLNTRYRATEKQPVRVHAFDFDRNGTLDPVLSAFIGGKSYPVASRDLLVDQMVSMKGRFTRFSDYADATLEKTLSKSERDSAFVARSIRFASSYLENRGGGRFAMRALPLPAQVSPAFGMLARDVDDDGNLDLLLAGNSRARDTQTGWDDASIGAVLLGDGKGAFRFVNGARGGFFAPGNAKAVAELVLDERRSLVLVTENADSLRVFAPVRRGARHVHVDPLDAYAMLTLADGSTRRVELYHGSTYLSQSSRHLRVPDGTTRAVVHDSRGRSRTLTLTPQIAGAPR